MKKSTIIILVTCLALVAVAVVGWKQLAKRAYTAGYMAGKDGQRRDETTAGLFADQYLKGYQDGMDGKPAPK